MNGKKQNKTNNKMPYFKFIYGAEDDLTEELNDLKEKYEIKVLNMTAKLNGELVLLIKLWPK